MKYDGTTVTAKDIAAVNAGTKCAVSEDERVENLLNQARQVQNDVAPANRTPMKRLCEYTDQLRLAYRDAETERLYWVEEILRSREVISDLCIELDLLRRPWWVKVLSWFASFGPQKFPDEFA